MLAILTVMMATLYQEMVVVQFALWKLGINVLVVMQQLLIFAEKFVVMASILNLLNAMMEIY